MKTACSLTVLARVIVFLLAPGLMVWSDHDCLAKVPVTSVVKMVAMQETIKPVLVACPSYKLI